MTEKFHYVLPVGQEIVLPRYKHLKAGIVRKIRKLSPADQIFTALEAVLDEEQLALLDDLDSEELNEFIAAWQNDSKVTQGE